MANTEEVMAKITETLESLNTRMAQQEEAFKRSEQERAAHDPGNPARVEPTAVSLRDFQDAMLEKRAITINGAGSIKVIRELFKVALGKNKIASRLRYFYGRDAQTNIPVLNPRPAVPSAAAEGATNLTPDSTAVMSVKSLTPSAYYSELPISYEALKMGAVDLEGELPAIFRDSFAYLIDNLAVTDMFATVPAANKVACGAAGLPTLEDMVNLAEKLVDKDIVDPVIVICGTAHAALLAEQTSEYSFVKEELARNGSVLGCEVIVTGKAPSTVTAGSTIAWGGSLQNVAVGVAADLSIIPIHKSGDTNTYFQAIMALAEDVIIDADCYGLKTV